MAKNSQAMTGTANSRRRRQTLTFEQMVQWTRDARNELRKVTWPTPEQTRNLTIVVIAVCIFLAVFLGVADFLLGLLVKTIVGY